MNNVVDTCCYVQIRMFTKWYCIPICTFYSTFSKRPCHIVIKYVFAALDGASSLGVDDY